MFYILTSCWLHLEWPMYDYVKIRWFSCRQTWEEVKCIFSLLYTSLPYLAREELGWSWVAEVYSVKVAFGRALGNFAKLRRITRKLHVGVENGSLTFSAESLRVVSFTPPTRPSPFYHFACGIGLKLVEWEPSPATLRRFSLVSMSTGVHRYDESC